MTDLSELTKTILLVFGLPGSGKTTLCEKIAKKIKLGHSVYFNADKVRSTLSKDLGFSVDDRVEQARRMACMASLALDGSGATLCLVDFVNPNVDTWTAFRNNLNLPVGRQRETDVNRVPGVVREGSTFRLFSVFMNTISKDDCRFADTADLFARGERPVDLTFSKFMTDEELDQAASLVMKELWTKSEWLDQQNS